MAEEIIISVSPLETRVALVESGLLQEIFIERSHTPVTVSNIYKGKVVRVLPGMQSAFVDIGQPRAAFMHITDLMDGALRVPGQDGSEPGYPPIQSVVHEGQHLLVQVTKEPISTKGARATTNISIASRFLVYMPRSHRIGVSQRIEDEPLRAELVEMIEEICTPEQGDGFIVRTASERATKEEIHRDAALLRQRWQSLHEGIAACRPASLVYEDLPVHLRVMRDIISRNTCRIHVDNQAVHDAMRRFMTDFIPDKLDCLNQVDEDALLFDTHDLEDQIATALNRKVPLKSGGYLIIDQTEAMTTVDVNTGGFVGRRDLEETIYRINLEAAAAIPRQLKLRNIGGIVIIDFIDMLDEEHKRQVLRSLEKGQQADRVKWNISEISQLGLVEMTRKRTHESLLKTMCSACEACDGKGYIKTAETVCLEIFRDIQRRARLFSGKVCLIMASQSVIDRLLDEDASCVTELITRLECEVKLQVESSYSQEQFDVVLLQG